MNIMYIYALFCFIFILGRMFPIMSKQKQRKVCKNDFDLWCPLKSQTCMGTS